MTNGGSGTTCWSEFAAAGCEFQRLHGMGGSFDYSAGCVVVHSHKKFTPQLSLIMNAYI